MMENGKMIKLMDLELVIQIKGIIIKDIGKMIKDMEMDIINGKTKMNIKEIGLIIKDVVMVIYIKKIGIYFWKNGNTFDGIWEND